MIIGDLIKSIILVTAIFIVSLIASAYVLYFVGMTMSLAAGAILGIAGVELAQIFAWIGVGATVLFFVQIVRKIIEGTTVQRVNISEEELAELLGEMDGKEDDN